MKDFARGDALRFPHKSFMECLVAQQAANSFSRQEAPLRVSRSIAAATGWSIYRSIDYPECLAFLGELLVGHYSVAGAGNANLARNLFREIVVNNVMVPAFIRRMMLFAVTTPYSIFTLMVEGMDRKDVDSEIAKARSRIRSARRATELGIFPVAVLLFALAWFIIFFQKEEFAKALSDLQASAVSPWNSFNFAMAIVASGMFVYVAVMLDLQRRRGLIVLWFTVLASLGVNQKTAEALFGKRTVRGLIGLSQRFGALQSLVRAKFFAPNQLIVFPTQVVRT